MTTVIKLKGISKVFKIPHEQNETLMSRFIGLLKKKVTYEELYALKDLNLEVQRGEVIGVIGPNASGKTTLLKLIAGIIEPSEGEGVIRGKLAPLLELGVGFESELTAKENVFLSGAIMGLSRKEIIERFDDIIGFAGLEKFVDMPLKNYSSGMYSRLAFAVALQTEGEIFLIDEIFSVGDKEFQKKCARLFNQMKKENKTVLFVSHDMSAIRKICQRTILLKEGTIVFDGKTSKAIELYEGMKKKDEKELRILELKKEVAALKKEIAMRDESIKAKEGMIKGQEAALLKRAHDIANLQREKIKLETEKAKLERWIKEKESLAKSGESSLKEMEVAIAQKDEVLKENNKRIIFLEQQESFLKKEINALGKEFDNIIGGSKGRWGNKDAVIEKVELLDSNNKLADVFKQGSGMVIKIHYDAKKNINKPMFGLALYKEGKVHVTGPNNVFAKQHIASIKGKGIVKYIVDSLPLIEGEYLLTTAIHDSHGLTPLDFHNKMYSFKITGGDEKYGCITLNGKWVFER